MSDKLTKANLKRTTAHKRLLETYDAGIKATSDESLKSIFLARADAVDDIYNDFQLAHNTVISLINDEEFTTYDNLRIEADEAYYGIKSIKNDFLISDSTSQTATASGLNNSTSTPKLVAKLPKLNLPTFNGDFKQWPAFHDLFKSLIHDNSELSNVEKFQYLLTSLNSEPLALVKSVPLTEANYPVAYDILQKRYQNKRILATQYYNEIISAPSIKRATFKDLRPLLNIFSENISALRALKFPVDQWDFLLFNMLLNKLDSVTRTDFELENSLSQELPTYRQLITFLERKCLALESVQYSPTFFPDKSKSKNSNSYGNSHNQNKRFPSSFVTGSVSTPTVSPNTEHKCILCSSSHALFKCRLFLAKTPRERFSYAKQNKLCVNCLVSSHALKNCSSSHRCRVCKFPHHTTLHFNESSPSNNTTNVNTVTSNANINTDEATPSTSGNDTSVTSIHCVTNQLSIPQHTVLLSTCEVDIKDIRGNFQKVRILLDTGSMANFISESCIRRLGLRRKRPSSPVEGLNGMSTSTCGMVQCIIKPCGHPDPSFSFEAIVIPKVCSDQPKMNINISQMEHIRNLKLADSRCHIPGPIDLLIGAELVPLFLRSGRINGNSHQPTALETVFGYILQGKTTISPYSNHYEPVTNCHVSLDDSIDFQLRKFWEIEQIKNISSLSPDEQKCEDIYKTLTVREPSGRFSVPLPFRQSRPVFVDTYSQAFRRFRMLENRFLRNSDLHSKYVNFMQDYLDSGHMSLVPQKDNMNYSAYYLAHHAVFKDKNSDSKIRVVFDASLRDLQGVSLNDTLLVGPKLQRDISSLLLNFRFYRYVFICDIKQMYRQINIHPDFWNYQRILWRFAPSEPLQEYFLKTVTYGVSSSPYLALRTLQELATQEESSFPKVAQVIRRQFYIDDGLVGSHDLESALELQSHLIEVLRRGGFELSKWASNHPDLLSAVPSFAVQESCTFDKDEPSFIKVLGLKWDPSSDVFSYSHIPIERPCTKRNILSEISRIFDPLGFISPCILLVKRLLQRLWESKVSWDEIPSHDVVQTWTKFKGEMPKLTDLKIPRHIALNPITRIELHGFCDASQIGYASAIYFRVEDDQNNVKTFLVCAKCRVAPLKPLSIARLELLAAVLLADLVAFVKDSYSDVVTFDAIYTWSDSMIVLAWLSSAPHRWKTFIANRVNHIQEIVPISLWRYVPSEQNPSDCASRPQTPQQLLDSHLWWSGPEFLSQSRFLWPTQPDFKTPISSELCKEEKQTVLTVSLRANNFIFDLLNRFSSLPKIQRIFSYICRFVTNLRSEVKVQGPLAVSEIESSFAVIIQHVQKDVFSDIFAKIEQNILLPKPFRKFAPFIDSVGLLRVGGRLKNSQCSYETKHPILLPKSHRLTELIVEYTHRIHFHPGIKTLHYLLLQQYWILSPKSTIYKCLSRCIRCFRSKPKSYNPYMADLPALRVSQVKAFSSVCIDFCGPFSLLMSRYRGVKTTKGYVCVFVCTATKAIHLEVTSDLSTDTFLAAFRRFVARRGRCVTIISDQGTNFKGAYTQLIELARNASEKLSISWKFNAPSSPHFNGLAEAGVKSFKTHFYRVLGTQILTYEEFYTLSSQVEALLNSRPLCPISADPNDLQPLTPGHFLNLEPLNSPIPDPDLSTLNVNRLTRWQLIQRLQGDFWKRWSQEYLHGLQERYKWTDLSPPVIKGSLVLIKNEQKPPLQWALGRVLELHPGPDGIVRVVTLKTNQGIMQRPVVKICPLPGN